MSDTELRYRRLAERLADQAMLVVDTDLRLVLAAGELLRSGGRDPATMRGTLLREVLPPESLFILEPHYLAALEGTSVDLDYTSPVTGRFLRIRIAPVSGDDGSIVGALSVSEDMSDQRFRQFELESLHGLSRIGTARYDRQSGWNWDRALLNMCGIDTVDGGAATGAGDPATAIAGLIMPADRTATLQAWAAVRSHGGECVTSYRLRHGHSGEIRHLQSSHRAVVDSRGILLHAMATHVDVSDSVIARDQAEQARRQAADDRAALLRRASGALAESKSAATDVFPVIVELAAVALRSGAILRVLTADRRSVERDVVAHHDQLITQRLAGAIDRTARSIAPGSVIREEVIVGGRMVSSIGRGKARPHYLSQFIDDAGYLAEQAIIAPVRHRGDVLGLFTVIRSSVDEPFEPADADLVQVLADSIGSAVAERRARTRSEEDQSKLLDHLAETESRERSMLAEAIHDEPMQLIIAAMLQLDHLRTQPGFSNPVQGENIVATLETAVNQLRRLIVAVTAPDFENGLCVALRNLAEGMFTGTQTTVCVNGPTHVPLTLSTKAVAYRILREALVNVRKHARAGTVTIALTDGPDAVVASVTDDGVGSADLHAGVGHLGLLAMRNRARAEAGRLSIQSAVGQGTTVVLTLPPADRAAVRENPLLRVVLVDGHALARQKVADLLDDEDGVTVVGQAASVAEALRLIPAAVPDVAVLDVRLPDGTGIELCRALMSLMPGLHCLMLTFYTDEEAMSDAILAGAAGYIIKDIKGMDLVDAVRAVGAGHSLLDSRATAVLINRLWLRTDLSTAETPLTGTEHTMLDLIGEGLTNRQIADRTERPPSTVAEDVSRLFTKLGAGHHR